MKTAEPEFRTATKMLIDCESAYDIARHLPAMVGGEILAIRVRDFRSEEQCQRDCKIIDQLGNGEYAQEPALRKGGPTIYDFEGNEDVPTEYFELAKEWNYLHRQVYAPFASAPDLLAGILADSFAPGVIPEPLKPGKIPSGQVVRIFKAGSQALPHHDRTEIDLPGCTAAREHKALFSALTYHSVASEGGDLLLYGDRFLDADEWHQARVPNHAYAIDECCLTMEPLRVSPRRGELIIFDAHRVHAVTTIYAGVRRTTSCFFPYRGPLVPLGRFA
jgi:2OG-Fe(II) oxygenase superfamily